MRNLMRVAAGCAAAITGLTAGADVFHDYEDLDEGFKGTTFWHQGVTFRDINNVSGTFTDGDVFGPDDLGANIMVERAVPLYNDFPTYGSPYNALTFGNAFVPGDNLSIGAIGEIWMDLDELGNAASFDIAYYENGPWGGIEFRLEAIRNGSVVATDSFVISDLGGRDNPNFTTMSVSAPEFDTLRLYGWWNGGFSGPRGIIDNLSITAVPEPGALAMLLVPAAALLRRRG